MPPNGVLPQANIRLSLHFTKAGFYLFCFTIKTSHIKKNFNTDILRPYFILSISRSYNAFSPKNDTALIYDIRYNLNELILTCSDYWTHSVMLQKYLCSWVVPYAMLQLPINTRYKSLGGTLVVGYHAF